MFRSIFRPYGPLWNFLNNVTDVLALSVLWCFCCLPIVTIGPASTALYDACVHGIRFGEGGVYRRFFRTLRNELKTGIGMTLLWGLILLFGAYVLAMLQGAGAEDTTAALMAGAYHVVLLVPIGAACWSVVILSRFTCSFRELTGTALHYLLSHPVSSVLLAVFTWVVCWFCADNPLSLTFAPAVCAIAWSFPVEQVFAKYGAGLAQTKEEL